LLVPTPAQDFEVIAVDQRGMELTATLQEQVNADLLAFLKS
jgi:hypothetical protein